MQCALQHMIQRFGVGTCDLAVFAVDRPERELILRALRGFLLIGRAAEQLDRILADSQHRGGGILFFEHPLGECVVILIRLNDRQCGIACIRLYRRGIQRESAFIAQIKRMDLGLRDLLLMPGKQQDRRHGTYCQQEQDHQENDDRGRLVMLLHGVAEDRPDPAQFRILHVRPLPFPQRSHAGSARAAQTRSA